MKTIAIIPARYQSSRFPGKPLAIIKGKPMLWWTYHQVKKAKSLDDVVVATDDKRILDECKRYNLKAEMTSASHDTPTSRMWEVSEKMESDFYVFVGGDEPLIKPEAIDTVVDAAKKFKDQVTHGMTKIKTSPEVIDFTNIKVTVSTEGYLLYTTRSPIPFPKGGLDFDYLKFVGVGVFTKKALDFYRATPKSKLEAVEECDLLRFVDKGVRVRMVEVECRNVSVDTPKDLEFIRDLIDKENLLNE